jgi:hypothetical protein
MKYPFPSKDFPESADKKVVGDRLYLEVLA